MKISTVGRFLWYQRLVGFCGICLAVGSNLDTVSCILKKSLLVEEHFELKSRFFLSETQKAIALKTPPVDKTIVENAVAARGG